MGWKNVKQHYRISHHVQVTKKGICIGSGYIHDIIIIDFEGSVRKGHDWSIDEKLDRYYSEMNSDLDKLNELVKSPDSFNCSTPVYTHDGADIIEKRCESLGYPNVTHDGCMMYENVFSADKDKVVRWAKKEAESNIYYLKDDIKRLRDDCLKLEARLEDEKKTITILNRDF